MVICLSTASDVIKAAVVVDEQLQTRRMKLHSHRYTCSRFCLLFTVLRYFSYHSSRRSSQTSQVTVIYRTSSKFYSSILVYIVNDQKFTREAAHKSESHARVCLCTMCDIELRYFYFQHTAISPLKGMGEQDRG